jgi:hypothetical protein
LKNKSFLEEFCCAKEPKPLYGNGGSARVFSNRGSSAWSAGPNLEDTYHGVEEEEEEGFLICRYRPLAKPRGALDAVVDRASARPTKGRPRAGPFAFELPFYL